MKNAVILSLLVFLQGSWLPITEEESGRILALRARLEYIIRGTKPWDTRPTVILQHGELFGGVFKCEISDLEGRRYWSGLSTDPVQALDIAVANYRKDLR